jgi:hypothetical protein
MEADTLRDSIAAQRILSLAAQIEKSSDAQID